MYNIYFCFFMRFNNLTLCDLISVKNRLIFICSRIKKITFWIIQFMIIVFCLFTRKINFLTGTWLTNNFRTSCMSTSDTVSCHAINCVLASGHQCSIDSITIFSNVQYTENLCPTLSKDGWVISRPATLKTNSVHPTLSFVCK